MLLKSAVLVAGCLAASGQSIAGGQYVEAKIARVFVNAGADGPNAGTTCFQMAATVAPACPYGLIAIPNNNERLISAALANRAADESARYSQQRVDGGVAFVYYFDDAPLAHCPASRTRLASP